MRRLVSTTLMVFFVSQMECLDKGVDVRPLKDPREYTWTVDTLVANPSAIQTEMMDIYATSPQNVYVVGITDWSGVNGNGVMWRYDGTKWSIVNQGFRGISLGSITGFAEYNIFSAGSKDTSALILHFDGTSWMQTILPGQGLFAIRGNSPSDLWAGGWMGSLFRSNGGQWSKVETDPNLSFKDFATYDGRTYAIAYRVLNSPPGTIQYFSLVWTVQQWDTLGTYCDTSASSPSFGLQSLSVIGDNLYSAGGNTTGPGLFKYVIGKWLAVGSIRVAKVFGSSTDGIFGVGTGSRVYFFNGSDWLQLEQPAAHQFNFWTGWTDGHEVFIVGHDGYKTIVLHGK